ncbi:ATP-binding protein [Fibrella sp. WM1]|uniref:hybrid sensor histidine kinase/response regulator n=1 Tax=Fibrella musci TaxID=3242485 RepID=UPI00352123B7
MTKASDSSNPNSGTGDPSGSGQNPSTAQDVRLEANELLRLAAEAANVYWWQLDLATTITTYSPNTEQVVGRLPAETVEENLLLLHVEDRSLAAQAFSEAMENGTDRFSYQVRSIAIPNEIRWLTVTGTILRNEQGQPYRIIGLTQNTTPTEKAQQALQAEQDRQTFLLQLSDTLHPLADPLAIQAAATQMTMAHLAADRCYYCEIEGDVATIRCDAYRSDLHSIAATYSLSDSPVFKTLSQAGFPLVVADAHTTELMDEPLRQLSIQLTILAFINVPVIKQGQLVGNFCITQCAPRVWTAPEVRLLQEVAQRTWAAVEQGRAEMALRESEKLFRLTIEAARVGTWDWNLVPNEVVWNEEHFRLFGMPPQPNPVSPKLYFDHVHPYDRDRVGNLLQAAIDSKGVFDTEFCALLDGGAQRWMSGYGRVTAEADGRSTRISGVMFDIEERRRAEDALREANRRKDEFLALLAHELRNPMATLSNTLRMLELTGGQHPIHTLSRSVRLMQQEVAHLVRLVDDLLDVSRISQGKIALVMERLDLVSLLSEVIEATGPQFTAVGKILSVALPDEQPNAVSLYVSGDSARLRQVVSNLLHNALKFTTQQGHVWLSLAQQGEEAVLRVGDNGIGIPPHELVRIFEMFAQVDTSLGRSQGGLGLGLTLVHELVGLHGGRVEASSLGLGQGSEFVVYLPLLPQPRPELVPDSMADLSNSVGHRLLIIDDNVEAGESLAMLLEVMDYTVATAISGQQGIQVAEQFRPTVILCDISMPGLDGYQTCRLIRAAPWGQSIVLIALTGYGQEEDKRRTKSAGFDAHLVKPIDITALSQLLAELPPPR